MKLQARFDVAGPAARGATLLTGCCRVFRTWNLSKARSSHPTVSSEVRAPDRKSGCHGFDSRTNTAGCKACKREERLKVNPTVADDCLVGRALPNLRKRGDDVAAAGTEAMQCVDTAERARSVCRSWTCDVAARATLAQDGAPKWSNDAAIAIAQTALRIGTCDQRSTPPPDGVFLEQTRTRIAVMSSSTSCTQTQSNSIRKEVRP
jgi:hypothetical protein